MSDQRSTKTIDVQSCIIAERYDDKHMILTIGSKVGSFEFVFSPSAWARLGETAGWFEVHVTKPSAEEK